MKFPRLAAALGLVAVAVLAGAAIRQAVGQSPLPEQPRFQPGVALGYQTPYGAAPQFGFAPGQSDKEMAKLLGDEARQEQEAARLVQQYSHTEDDGERTKIRSKLAEVLEKQFDLQQKRRDLDIKHIEAQLKKVRQLMEKRSDARRAIIDRHLDQLLREADGLGWTPPPGPHVPQFGGYYGPMLPK
jgi:hypothetical protein